MSFSVAQRDLTIVRQVDANEESLESFSCKLRAFGDDVQNKMNATRDYLMLEGCDELHFASVTMIPSVNDSSSAHVVLELSFDEGRFFFLRKLLKYHRKSFLDVIFGPCKNYPTIAPRANEKWPGLTVWLKEWSLFIWLWLGSERSTFYNGHTGRSRRRVLDEEKLRLKVHDFVIGQQEYVSSRKNLWRLVSDEFADDPTVLNQPTVPRRVRRFYSDVRAHLYFCIRVLFRWFLWLAGIGEIVFRIYKHVSPNTLSGDPLARISLLEMSAFFVIIAGAFAVTLVVWIREQPRYVALRQRLDLALSTVSASLVSAINAAAFLGIFSLIFRFLWEPWMLLIFTEVILLLGVALSIFALVSFSRIVGSLLAIILLFLAARMIEYPIGTLLNPDLNADFLRYVKVWAPFTFLCYLLPIALLSVRLIYVRRAEQNDKDDPVTLDEGPMKFKRRRENKQLHSHFAATGSLRTSKIWTTDGKLRVGTLKILFRIIGFLHRYYLTQGWLGTISSIHFARWIILDDGRLLFLTNYDGGFAAYLGVFSENPGTTGVFGHIEGFPKPYFLLWDGARREQFFIDFAREKQVESLIWFSAYPNITVMDINRSAQLCRALSRPVDDGKKGLIADFRRMLKWPVNEDEISEILRTTLSVANR